MLKCASSEVNAAILLPCHAIALSMTCFRLYCQRARNRLWWDDLLAAIALLGDIFYVTGIILLLSGPSRSITILLVFFFYFVTWTTRVSIGLSIMRNCVPILEITENDAEKTVLCWPFHAMNIAFGAMFVMASTSGLLSFFTCTSTPNSGVDVKCPMQIMGSVTGLTTNAISDALLIFVPLYTLRRVKVTGKQRWMIYAIFTANTLSSVPSVIYMIGQYFWHNLGCLHLIVAFKIPILLIVCNLLIIVTYVYSHFGREGDRNQGSASSETDKPVLTTCVVTQLL